jgi:flagellar biosynthetic protein FliR/FlhB
MDLILTHTELAAWLMVMARLCGWAWADPVVGRLPWLARVFLAGALAWVWVPAAGVTADPLSWPGLLALAGEFLFGALLGGIVRLFFAVAEFALQTVGLTASLGLTQVVPGQQGGLDAPLRQLAFWLALLAFFSANGQGLVIQALSASFASLAPAALPAQGAAMQLAEAGGMVLAAGLQLALPLLVLVLLGHLAFAVLSRMMPGAEVFSLGLVLGATGVLAGLALAAPLLASGMLRVLERLPALLALPIP